MNNNQKHDEHADTDLPQGRRIAGTGAPGDGKGQIEIVGTASVNRTQPDGDNEVQSQSRRGGDSDAVDQEEK